MKIRCTSCAALYSVEEANIPATGAKVRCKQCDTVFIVTKDAGTPPLAQSIPVPKVVRNTLRPPGAVASPAPIATAATQMIEAEAPRGNLPKDMATAPTQRRLARPSYPPPPRRSSNPPPPAGEPDLSQIRSAVEDDQWDRGSPMELSGTEWENRTGTMTRTDVPFQSIAPKKRRVGRWIGLGAVLLIAIAVFYVVKYQRPKVDGVVGSIIQTSQGSRLATYFDRGRERFLLDSFADYRQAEREFQKVLGLEENYAPALAALAEMYAVWAAYLNDAMLDRKTTGALGSAVPDPELALIQRDIAEKLNDAANWAKQAVAANPKLPEGQRAMAEVLLLQGDQKAAQTHLETALELQNPPTVETEYTAVLVALAAGGKGEAAVAKLEQINEATPLIRALYRQARLQASLGDQAGAKRTLSRLFELSPDHLQGRDLATRMDDGEKIVVSAKTAAPLLPAQSPKMATSPITPSPSPAAATPPATSSTTTTTEAGAPVDFESILNQATRAQKVGSTRKAIDLFGRALALSPSNVEALTGLAYCHLDQSNTGQALAHFRRALTASPSYGSAIIGIAETFKKQGQDSQALKYYKKYTQTNPTGRDVALAQRNIAILEAAMATALPPAAESPSPTPAPLTESPAPSPATPIVDEEAPAPVAAPPSPPSADSQE